MNERKRHGANSAAAGRIAPDQSAVLIDLNIGIRRLRVEVHRDE